MRDEKEVKLPAITRLLGIMEQLRDPHHGCPWDVKQTMQSLTRYTIEETYEVVDAIENGTQGEIKDELGDLLFQIVFYAQIAKENNDFCFDDVAEAISDKLVRRHPHVFAQTTETDAPLSQVALAQQWDAIKREEQANNGKMSHRILDAVPSGLPALMYAQKMQKACAKVGFDWPDVAPVLAKVQEEVQEIGDELHADTLNPQAVEEEIGDALFAMVNLARHLQVDADTALRKASHKFATRFNGVEALVEAHNAELSSMTLAEMEGLWQQVKANEKG